VDEAVRRYEETMFPRAERAVTFAATGLERAIAPDAPAHTLAMMTALSAGRDPFEQSA